MISIRIEKGVFELHRAAVVDVHEVTEVEGVKPAAIASDYSLARSIHSLLCIGEVETVVTLELECSHHPTRNLTPCDQPLHRWLGLIEPEIRQIQSSSVDRFELKRHVRDDAIILSQQKVM